MIDNIINVNSNTCCTPILDGDDQLIHDYWCQVNKCVMNKLNKGYADELYGYDSECAFNGVNNFFYLLDLLIYIKRDNVMNPLNTIDYYRKKYDIDCIEKTFMCHGCNISDALSVFGFKSYVATPCTDTGGVPGLVNCANPMSICTGIAFNYPLVSNVPNTNITWSRAAVTGISNVAAIGIGSINETLINITIAPITVTYIITLNCNGIITIENLYVTVNPSALMTSAHTVAGTACECPSSGAVYYPILFSYNPTTNIPGTICTWSRPGIDKCPSGSDSGNSGTGSIHEYLPCHSQDNYTILYTYTMTTPTGCISTQVITVNVTCIECIHIPG